MLVMQSACLGWLSVIGRNDILKQLVTADALEGGRMARDKPRAPYLILIVDGCKKHHQYETTEL